MAFLFEADRGLTAVKDPYPHLGPGTYSQTNNKQETGQSYAPFLSTGQRVIPMV